MKTDAKKDAKKTAVKKSASKPKEIQKKMAGVQDFSVLIKPVITEKSSMIGQSGNRIVFKVAVKTTKLEIKQAIERVFGVTVKSVNTVNMLGKVKRTVRGIGRKPSYKKAYVTLAEGQSVSVVEGL